MSHRLPAAPWLMWVTDGRLAGGSGGGVFADALAEAAGAGLDAVQVRARDLPAGASLELVRTAVSAAGGRALVLVNDRADIAMAARADGVHLPAAGLPPAACRQLLRPGMLLGRSIHPPEAEPRGDDRGVDYLVFGTVYATASKPGIVPAGVEALTAACRATALPVLAIGGVTAANAADCVAAGAAGCAVQSAIGSAAKVSVAVAELKAALRSGWERRAATACTLNGRPYRLDGSLLLPELLARLGADPRSVAVELNGNIVDRRAYALTAVRPGDRLEVVRALGGG